MKIKMIIGTLVVALISGAGIIGTLLHKKKHQLFGKEY